MDEKHVLEVQEMEIEAKKAAIAEIKLDEILEGATNRRLSPSSVVELT